MPRPRWFPSCLLTLTLALSVPALAVNAVAGTAHGVDGAPETTGPSSPVTLGSDPPAPALDGAWSAILCHIAFSTASKVEDLVLASWICRIAAVLDGEDLPLW